MESRLDTEILQMLVTNGRRSLKNNIDEALSVFVDILYFGWCYIIWDIWYVVSGIFNIIAFIFYE